MAFEQPLEADRAVTFGLLSTLVQAPLYLLGTVLGSSRRKRAMDAPHMISDIEDDDDDEDEDYHSLSSPVQSPDSAAYWNRTAAASGGSAPTSKEQREQEQDEDCSHIRSQLKRSCRLSWSDESGKQLAEYADESVPSASTALSSMEARSVTTKPVKSAMRRSASAATTRYLPRFEDNKRLLLHPTRPFGPLSSGPSNAAGSSNANANHNSSSGLESPQWGFFTNITPPTPEMYAVPHYYGKSSSTPLETTHEEEQQQQQYARPPNQVFQALQANTAAKHPRSGGVPHGWSSVPM